jgi:SAM-dependent methyltransferase
MTVGISANSGSFRDPINRVYEVDTGGAKRILRGVDQNAFDSFRDLAGQTFFQKLVRNGHIIQTDILANDDPATDAVRRHGWSGVLEHEAIPFVSYPYEWTFSMLKDAALLQLHILEQALENGWTLKDATPYNIQFIGARPVFIDLPSFEPWIKGEPWVGYRQFCAMYLTPLLLKSHLGLDHLTILRSNLDGLAPTEAVKYFRGLARFQKGVLSHIAFPARVEASIAARERDDAPVQKRRQPNQSVAMVVGLVQSLSRLVRKLKSDITHTDWSHYDKTHTYQDADFEAKKAFVEKHAAEKPRDHIWDIGCNTGTFSKICAPHCKHVISLDGDHNAVEQLYLREKGDTASNLLPIVMNLSNISPGQGWAGAERLAFDKRKSPDLVLCLALIHHIRLSANIPNALFLEWLRSLDSDILLEFVTREDEMVVKLLTNKKEQYDDYDLAQFIEECERFFTIRDRDPLKGGKREIFYLEPK